MLGRGVTVLIWALAALVALHLAAHTLEFVLTLRLLFL